MPNRNYERGVRFERELMHRLEKSGYIAYRTAGSHGAYDIIAFHYPTKVIQMWQCKTKLKKAALPKQEAIDFLECPEPGWQLQGMKITKFIKRRNK